jgi:hypothetical protein
VRKLETHQRICNATACLRVHHRACGRARKPVVATSTIIRSITNENCRPGHEHTLSHVDLPSLCIRNLQLHTRVKLRLPLSGMLENSPKELACTNLAGGCERAWCTADRRSATAWSFVQRKREVSIWLPSRFCHVLPQRNQHGVIPSGESKGFTFLWTQWAQCHHLEAFTVRGTVATNACHTQVAAKNTSLQLVILVDRLPAQIGNRISQSNQTGVQDAVGDSTDGIARAYLIEEGRSGEDRTTTAHALPLEAVTAIAGRRAAVVRRSACERFPGTVVVVVRLQVKRRRTRWWDRLVVSAVAPLDGSIHCDNSFHRGMRVANHHIYKRVAARCSKLHEPPEVRGNPCAKQDRKLR